MGFTQQLGCDVILGESAPFSEVAAFVDRARAAGATADTPVQAVPVAQDDSIIDYLGIELDVHVDTPDGDAIVNVHINVIRQLRDLLDQLRTSDGDVRDRIGEIAQANAVLANLADGHDVGDHIDWD
jgi:hypothetical protein